MTSLPDSIESSPWLVRASLAETLQALVQINSVNPAHGGPAGGERRVLEWAAEWLRARGIEARLSGPDPYRVHLRARVEGTEPGPPLLFETHVDTVSIDGMKIDPFAGKIDGGRLWGRGSTDAKGQAAAMLHALASWKRTPPPRTIELALVPDEEFGFSGAMGLIQEGISVHGIVIGEPTDLRVVSCHKGAARFEVLITGKLAHAAHPERGINAISAAAILIDEIHNRLFPDLALRQAPLLGPATLNIARISGGSQPNLVPDSCRIYFERRLLPGETAEEARAEVEELFPLAAARFPGFHAEIPPTLLEAAAFQTDPQSPLARAAGRAAVSIGSLPDPIGVAYCTDASQLRLAGVPLIVAGPGSIEQAHTDDEWIDLGELERGTRFYANLMGWDGDEA